MRKQNILLSTSFPIKITKITWNSKWYTLQQWINKCLSVLVPTLRIWHSESRWAMQIDILSSHNMTQIHMLMIILYCTSIIYIVLCIYNSFICISPQKGFTLLSLISSSILLIQCCQIVIVCILCQINKKIFWML